MTMSLDCTTGHVAKLMLAMAMSDTAAEACVAYLLDQLVSDGRDAGEAVLLMHRSINKWSEAHGCQAGQSGQEITQEG